MGMNCGVEIASAAEERIADSAALVAEIDRALSDVQASAGIEPAPAADDATFLRRVTLDLAGRIPFPAEIERYLADPAPDKRARRIDELLRGPGYPRRWGAVWRHVLLPQADTPQFAALGPRFESRLQRSLAAGRPFDRLAFDLLVPPAQATGEVPAAEFAAASEFKPENLAAASTRAFLGLNLDCAQCHDHPFSSWTRRQFWETAAFFARPNRKTTEANLLLSVTIPETEIVVGPRFLDGTEPILRADSDDVAGRRLLAEWITARDNRYFARNITNRVWAELFGTGLVEPLDDLSDRNPSVHSKLLDRLAEAFVAHDCDLRFLLRTLTRTATYGRSARRSSGESVPAELFARTAVRGLTGEQLYDSLRVAAGDPLPPADPDDPAADPARQDFLERFRSEREGTAERSILQSLELQNGPLTGAALAGKTVTAAAEAPWLNAAGRLRWLYLASLGRPPSASEAEELLPLLDRPDPAARRIACGEVFWALVNSAEFGTNR